MLDAFAQTQEQVQFLDCGPGFLDKEAPDMLDRKLMPDALHPNAAGGSPLNSSNEDELKTRDADIICIKTF